MEERHWVIKTRKAMEVEKERGCARGERRRD